MSFGLRRSKFELKSDAEFELMREAGLVVARALEAVKNEVRSGIRTIDLDRIAEQVIRDSNATPGGWMRCVETVSLGNVARSTIRTL